MMEIGKWLIGAALVTGAVLLSRPAKARPPVLGGGYAQIRQLGSVVEPHIPGFSNFAVAVARRESRGDNLALGTHDAGAACRGFERNAESRFAANPYPKEAWCKGSGGWFGFIPSTALAAPGFENLNPDLIHDPKASVAMLADYIRRLGRMLKRLPAAERTWLAVRRFMAGNTVGLDWTEQKVLNTDTDGIPRAAKVRERFAKDLQATGTPPSWMNQRARVDDSYPGALSLWHQMEVLG